ncbi:MULTISPECIES: hypothetical protein [unclassified Streptomyces]|uniref:hypothetical protein n=1 Tax=unclassified Streptomyces TaxID=2593676 RepID=UPI002DDA2C8F|nr:MULTISPECIES: hypothetical protein [unclassified Streptomyces]WSA96127.1 hypothetical protein OIE63_34655 [Streptomyces sp. NBC_01795]WSB80541.1 hypothetical protein OHB04_35760 [Streptomyces sp. NBC_01775]WSS11251.1 hypothetical protein OG533_04495 [Streptomyces sp. NBC_01186]WSS39960.1 hypothetical protein OG220_04595 [Streptomyces sp. NBC_01187]
MDGQDEHQCRNVGRPRPFGLPAGQLVGAKFMRRSRVPFDQYLYWSDRRITLIASENGINLDGTGTWW